MIKEYKIISKNNLNMVVKSGSKIVQIPTVETESDIIFLDDTDGQYTVVNSKNVKKQSAKALANVSLKLGKMSADSACCYIFHQPKMPETLRKMKKM